MPFFSINSRKSDESLMVLVQAGNHRAFSELYDRYANRMKGYFLRMLWYREDVAEDYVHDIFLKIIENPERFNTEMKFLPWFFQVASNMCKNAYRKKAFDDEYRNQMDRHSTVIPMIEKEIDERIERDELQKVLDKMDEEKRNLYLMRYQQELSIKELSEVFETNEGTIKSRLHQLRKTLMLSLSNVNIEQDGRQAAG